MKSRFALACLGLALSPAAYADDVYRSVMPNGTVMYGESPEPGAKSVRKVPRPPSGVTIVTPADQARAAQIQYSGGGTSVVPEKKRESYTPATAGTGAPSGQGGGPLPKKDY